jgi:7-cyano-7-deazaguanine reductase
VAEPQGQAGRGASATFRVPASSPNLIESKSFKLYLNSFNQTAFADSREALKQRLHDTISRAPPAAPVSVKNRSAVSGRPQASSRLPGRASLLDELDISLRHATSRPRRCWPAVRRRKNVEETLYSHLLKSNCLVTGQPDWAMVVIRYCGARSTTPACCATSSPSATTTNSTSSASSASTATSSANARPEALAVYARYTRRGGLDINPFRSSGEFPPPDNAREVRQ